MEEKLKQQTALASIAAYIEKHESLRDGALDKSTVYELLQIAKDQLERIEKLEKDLNDAINFMDTLGDMALRYVPTSLTNIVTLLRG